MGYITVTNSFTAGTPAVASAVNQNFADIVAGTSDGNKNLNMKNGVFTTLQVSNATFTCATVGVLRGSISIESAATAAEATIPILHGNINMTGSLNFTIATQTMTSTVTFTLTPTVTHYELVATESSNPTIVLGAGSLATGTMLIISAVPHPSFSVSANVGDGQGKGIVLKTDDGDTGIFIKRTVGYGGVWAAIHGHA
jgi:hypothetical protein